MSSSAPVSRLRRHAVVALLPLVLAACGGGGGGDPDDDDDLPALASCSVADRQAWLRELLADDYLWAQWAPRPSPAGYGSVETYFDALLYTGGSADFPDADRWSYWTPTADHESFYDEGRTLGYGVSVAGIEVEGRPDLPLVVRAVEPESDAGAKGVARGDEIVSIDGVAAAELIADGSYAVLTPERVGRTITVVLRRGAAERSVTLTATEYPLTPVPTATVVTSPLGRKLGYVVVRDMISQAGAPLERAFASFRAAGVDEIVLDLRYNGGGLVSVATTVGSYVAGSRGAGEPFATLLHNSRQQDRDRSYRFRDDLASAAGVARVFVLTGPRTCSASEQVINGLRGVGIDVVAIGDATCGKPVGFEPVSDGCGTTWSYVSFESVNARNEGRYFDGFLPTCAVAEDFGRPLGAADEPLLAAAARFADSGSCPVAAAARSLPPTARRALRLAEPGEPPRGMIAR